VWGEKTSKPRKSTMVLLGFNLMYHPDVESNKKKRRMREPNYSGGSVVGDKRLNRLRDLKLLITITTSGVLRNVRRRERFAVQTRERIWALVRRGSVQGVTGLYGKKGLSTL